MAHVEGARKPRKKENFLRRARRFGKKGNYGRGRKLSDEQYTYYMKVLEEIKHLQGEEKEILVRNFINELQQEGQGKMLASNQIVSRILDDAIPLADITQVLAMNNIFAEDLRALCVDPFASHVVQTLLLISLKYAQKGAVQKRTEEEEGQETKEVLIYVSEEERLQFTSFLSKVGRFIYNNLEEFVSHTYASHVMRTVLEVCSGVGVDHAAKNSQHSQTSHALRREDFNSLDIPIDMKQLLLDIAVRFTKLPNLPDIMSTECGSAVLQALLLVLKSEKQEQCSAVVSHLAQHGLPGIEEWYMNNPDESQPLDLPPLFQDQPTTRLLEVLLTCCSSEQQKDIFRKYFKGRIKILVQHQTANFAVQRLLSSWIDKESFEEVYEETSEALTTALNTQHCGVIHSLTSACRKLGAKQSSCIKALMDLLECNEAGKAQDMFVLLLLWMLPYSKYKARHDEGSLPSVSLQGSLALQELLHFGKPIKLVNSLLTITLGELQVVGCDPRASHVVDAFLSSSTISTKNKEKLVYRFKGKYTALACSKHGSRVLEALWKVASIKAKTQICNELLADELKLKGSPFGKIILTTFQVGMFKKGDKSDWQQLIDQTDKKRKMFDDLLNDDGESNTKGKHKKKSKPL